MNTSKRLVIFGFIILWLITGSSASVFALAQPDTILARVGDRCLTRNDLNNYLKLFKHTGTYEECDFSSRKQYLENLINRYLLLEEARRQDYFTAPDLKKHAHLDQSEKETFVLRQFLGDRISRPGTATPEQVKSYQAEHPGMNFNSAKEEVNRRLRLEIFNQLVGKLRQRQNIIVYEDQLK